jgi:hypothetical protein
VGNSAKFTRQGVISINAGVSEDNTKARRHDGWVVVLSMPQKLRGRAQRPPGWQGTWFWHACVCVSNTCVCVSCRAVQVYMTVMDTGVGIPKEKISKIFGAFEQVGVYHTHTLACVCFACLGSRAWRVNCARKGSSNLVFTLRSLMMMMGLDLQA